MTPYVWGRAPMEGGWEGGREIDIIQFNLWVERTFYNYCHKIHE